MKKKVIIILTTIMLVVAAWAAINYRQNKRYADSIGKVNQPSDGEYRSKTIYKIDEPYSGRAGRVGGQMDVWEGYTNNIHLDVKLEQGVVLVLFYDWADSETEPETLEDNPDKYLFRTERITKSGSYDYNMDDLPAGRYWVIINEEEAEDRDKKTVAEVDVCFSNYKKNKGD